MVNCHIRGLLCYWLQEARLNLQALVWRTVVLDSNCMNNKKSKCTNLALCATGTSIYKTIKGLSLTQWGWDKMQRVLSNAFSSMKMLEFQLKIHWSLFLWVQLTISQHWFKWWLVTDQVTNHYLNQCWLEYQRIYVSLGLNELKMPTHHQWTSLVANMELQEVCIKSGNLLLTYVCDKYNVCVLKILIYFSWWDNIFQNGWWEPANSHGTFEC